MELHFSPDPNTMHLRGTMPGISPQTVRNMKIFSPSPALFRLPSISHRSPGLMDANQIISKSRGAILNALGPSNSNGNLPKNYITACDYERASTQKIHRNCSCHKKPNLFNRNTNSLNCTANKIRRKPEYFAYEEEEHNITTPQQPTHANNENAPESGTANNDITDVYGCMGTCQRLDSILADVSIPFENGVEMNSNCQQQNEKTPSGKTRNLHRNTVGGCHAGTYIKKENGKPIIQLKKEILERKTRLTTYQNEILNSMESENENNESFDKSDNDFPVAFTQANADEKYTNDNSFVLNDIKNTETMQNRMKVPATKKAEFKSKLEQTTKFPIQSLLRPITEKDRDYQQKMKEDIEETGMAAKPYVVKKINTKSGKTEIIQQKKMDNKKENKDKDNGCIIF